MTAQAVHVEQELKGMLSALGRPCRSGITPELCCQHRPGHDNTVEFQREDVLLAPYACLLLAGNAAPRRQKIAFCLSSLALLVEMGEPLLS